MTLHFLEFDVSDDAQGTHGWEALASVTPERLPELLAEIAAVLTWAHQHFGHERGPIEAGGSWDYDLQCERAQAPPQTLRFDHASGTLAPPPDLRPDERVTLALALCGSSAFAHAFFERFPPG